MSSTNASTWSVTLLVTCLLGVAIGLSLGYALFSPRSEGPPQTAVPQPGEVELAQAEAGPAHLEGAESEAPPAGQSKNEAPTEPPEETPEEPKLTEPVGFLAGQHVFIAVNGQWLAEGTKAFLREIKPGGVVLRRANLQNRSQTLALVNEIKRAVGLGEGLGDLPLIAAAQEGGRINLLALADFPSARELGESSDTARARKLGRNYAQASIARGIAVTLGPVIDVYEPGTVDPGLEQRTFGTDQTVVANIGLAMAEGLRAGGTIPVVKNFPGYGAATYGPDGLLVVLNKDFSGLARVMYPFNEAVRRGILGIVVGYVAVPALDKEDPRRPAALSSVLVTDLLRRRWRFEGVILADDISLSQFTSSRSVERTAVEALAAGCDALLMLDTNPQHVRNVLQAIEKAVETGELSAEALEQSKQRLARWQELLTLESTPDSTLQAMDAPVETAPLPREETRAAVVTPPVEERTLVAGAQELPRAVPSRIDEPVRDEESLKTMTVPETTLVPELPEQADPEPEELRPAAVVAVASEEAAPEPAVVKEEEVLQHFADETPLGAGEEDTAPVPDEPEEEAEEPPGPTIAVASVSDVPSGEENAEGGSVVHTVREAESLTQIASLYGVAKTDILRWNALSGGELDAGTELLIRLDEKEALAADAPGEVPPEKEEAPPTPILEGATYKVVHTVVSGETLSGLASRYVVTAEDISLWNGLDDGQIRIGDMLTVFVNADRETTAAAPEPATIEYQIQAGDTLTKIAERFGTTRDVLMKLNQLENPDNIFVGQKLLVPAGS